MPLSNTFIKSFGHLIPIIKNTSWISNHSKAPSLIFKFIGLLLLASIITGCENTDAEQVTSQTNSISQSASRQTFCNISAKPFIYTVCSIEQSKLLESNSHYTLKLYWKPELNTNPDSTTHASENSTDQPISSKSADTFKPLYTFNALLADLAKDSTLKFAVNAGMYDSEFAPIGYTVIRGKQILSLNLKEGGGNFHLLPNGVLWWNKDGKVTITESNKMSALLGANQAKPWYATQSGPMLVINGKIHPKFNKNSTSKKYRNGVGVCKDGQIKFVNSQIPVNFYEFAQLFKSELNCANALFLDGGIASALYAPEIGINDQKNMGVILGLIEQ